MIGLEFDAREVPGALRRALILSTHPLDGRPDGSQTVVLVHRVARSGTAACRGHPYRPDMHDLLGAGVEDQIAVLYGRARRRALEEVGHHDTYLAKLAAKKIPELLGMDRVGTCRLVWQ